MITQVTDLDDGALLTWAETYCTEQILGKYSILARYILKFSKYNLVYDDIYFLHMSKAQSFAQSFSKILYCCLPGSGSSMSLVNEFKCGLALTSLGYVCMNTTIY